MAYVSQDFTNNRLDGSIGPSALAKLQNIDAALVIDAVGYVADVFVNDRFDGGLGVDLIARLNEMCAAMADANGAFNNDFSTAGEIDPDLRVKLQKMAAYMHTLRAPAAWDFSFPYRVGDIVTYAGALYRSVADIPAPTALSFPGEDAGTLGCGNVNLVSHLIPASEEWVYVTITEDISGGAAPYQIIGVQGVGTGGTSGTPLYSAPGTYIVVGVDGEWRVGVRSTPFNLGSVYGADLAGAGHWQLGSIDPTNADWWEPFAVAAVPTSKDFQASGDILAEALDLHAQTIVSIGVDIYVSALTVGVAPVYLTYETDTPTEAVKFYIQPPVDPGAGVLDVGVFELDFGVPGTDVNLSSAYPQTVGCWHRYLVLVDTTTASAAFATQYSDGYLVPGDVYGDPATGNVGATVFGSGAGTLYIGGDSQGNPALTKLAHVAVWSGSLSAPQRASYFAGTDPATINVANLLLHEDFS